MQEESRFDEAQIISDDDDEADDDVTFMDIHDMIILEQNETDDLTQVECELPPHHRCAAHTLSLVASTDMDKHLQSSTCFKSVYRSSFAKCMALWNKTRRSTIAADKMNEKLKRKLLVPLPTRCYSFYDSTVRLLEKELCSGIGLHSFSEKELNNIMLYVLEPLSSRLDTLQGEDHCYYGTLLPILETIVKILRMKYQICHPP